MSDATPNRGNELWQQLGQMSPRWVRLPKQAIKLQQQIAVLLAAVTDPVIEGCWIDLRGTSEPLWVPAPAAETEAWEPPKRKRSVKGGPRGRPRKTLAA